MSISNYRKFRTEDSNLREDIFIRRDADTLDTLEVLRLNPLSEEIYKDLTIESEIWKPETRYYKLSYKYYGNPDYWWLVAWFNPDKPTDMHPKPGDVIHIPLPLGVALISATRGA